MPDRKSAKSAERQERLAAALRTNLRKRKAQSRARRDAEPAGADAQPEPDLHQPDPSANP